MSLGQNKERRNFKHVLMNVFNKIAALALNLSIYRCKHKLRNLTR